MNIYMRSWLCEVKSETMPRDPVCGVVLNEKTDKFKISHECACGIAVSAGIQVRSIVVVVIEKKETMYHMIGVLKPIII